MGGFGLCEFLHRAWAREGTGRLVESILVLGEGLLELREGCGGFRVDSNSPDLVGEGSKGPRGGLRLGAWGGFSGLREGFGGVWVCMHSFTGHGQERAVGAWWNQVGCLGRASWGREWILFA